MKNQALFSLKDKVKKKIKCRLLQFFVGALRVNSANQRLMYILHNLCQILRTSAEIFHT